MNQNSKTSLFTVLFIFLGLLFYTKIFGPIPFSVNSITTTKTDLFSVQGSGEEAAVPDTALVSIGVTKNASNVLDAQNQANSIANKITQDLKNLGIQEKNIKTTNYSLSPNYDYSNGKQTINGYTVSENLEVKISPIDKANKAIDIATGDGANIVGNIEFVVNDDKQKELEQKAREEAINNAKEKAQSIAQAAGIRLGRIVNVQETSEPRPIMFEARPMAAMKSDTNAPTTLTPGENKITSTISLSYETF